jgi:hypothetical protein
VEFFKGNFKDVMAGLGSAGRGTARRGLARQGLARLGKARVGGCGIFKVRGV